MYIRLTTSASTDQQCWHTGIYFLDLFMYDSWCSFTKRWRSCPSVQGNVVQQWCGHWCVSHLCPCCTVVFTQLSVFGFTFGFTINLDVKYSHWSVLTSTDDFNWSRLTNIDAYKASSFLLGSLICAVQWQGQGTYSSGFSASSGCGSQEYCLQPSWLRDSASRFLLLWSGNGQDSGWWCWGKLQVCRPCSHVPDCIIWCTAWQAFIFLAWLPNARSLLVSALCRCSNHPSAYA